MRLHIWSRSGRSAACRLLAPALFALVAFSGSAMACSCSPNPTAQGILASAAAVFTGVVENSVEVTPGQSMTTFRVTESFKDAPPGKVVHVSHPSGSSASCGVKFLVGKVYTLAAHKSEAPRVLSTGLCSTWMFLPHVRLSKGLIDEMRARRQR